MNYNHNNPTFTNVNKDNEGNQNLRSHDNIIVFKKQELISINEQKIGDATTQTINARDLHAFLGTNKDFSDWIKYQINTFGFEENQDFVIVPENGEQYRQGVALRKDYFLTLNMAKELAMVSRCALGKQARQYFIECEKKARSVNPANLSRLQLIELAMKAEQERVALSEKVAVLAPKAEALDRISKSDGSVCITTAAKNLQIQPKDLFSWLQAKA